MFKKRKRKMKNKKTKRASESGSIAAPLMRTESGLTAEAAGAAAPTRNAVYRRQPSSEPKTKL